MIPHFAWPNFLWLWKWPSKLKSHFFRGSFSRLTFQVRRGPCLTCTESTYVCLVPPPQWSPWLFSCWKLTWMTAKLPLVRNRTGKQWEMKRGILFKTGAMSILLARRLAQLWWDCSVSDLGVSLARPPSKANCSNGMKWKPILVWTGSWCAINTFVMFEHLENIICTTVCRTPRDWRAKVNITVSASIIELKKRQFFGWSMATAAVRSTSCLLGRWDNSCHPVHITCSLFPPDCDPTSLQPLRVLPISSLCQRRPTLQMVISQFALSTSWFRGQTFKDQFFFLWLNNMFRPNWKDDASSIGHRCTWHCPHEGLLTNCASAKLHQSWPRKCSHNRTTQDSSAVIFGEDVAFGGVFRCTVKCSLLWPTSSSFYKRLYLLLDLIPGI